jgi:hypothetical protein
VRVYTAHLRAKAPPVLVREGFSWGALIFGPLWLFWHGAWIAGALALAADLAISMFPDALPRVAGELALAWALGLWGQDLRRLSLARRGYLLAHVIAAADGDAAFARLLTARPDLIGEAAAA